MTHTIRTLDESDLEAADRILRLAFGRFVGHPDPPQMFGDTGTIRTRWREAPRRRSGPTATACSWGSNFATGWGSVGFFGPLSVHPDHWGQGIASPLIGAVLDLFSAWGTETEGLFTFPRGPLHIGLYQKFGFWPRFLTAILSKAASPMDRPPGCAPDPEDGAVPDEESRDLCGAIHPGLDVGREIVAVRRQGLGQVVALREDGALVGLAVCHLGPGTEAGSDTVFVKFGGVRPGPDAGPRFDRLLAACEWLAATRGMGRVVLGINTACRDAYLRAGPRLPQRVPGGRDASPRPPLLLPARRPRHRRLAVMPSKLVINYNIINKLNIIIKRRDGPAPCSPGGATVRSPGRRPRVLGRRETSPPPPWAPRPGGPRGHRPGPPRLGPDPGPSPWATDGRPSGATADTTIGRRSRSSLIPALDRLGRPVY